MLFSGRSFGSQYIPWCASLPLCHVGCWPKISRGWGIRKIEATSVGVLFHPNPAARCRLLARSRLSGRKASLSRSSGNIRPSPKALRVLVCGMPVVGLVCFAAIVSTRYPRNWLCGCTYNGNHRQRLHARRRWLRDGCAPACRRSNPCTLKYTSHRQSLFNRLNAPTAAARCGSFRL